MNAQSLQVSFVSSSGTGTGTGGITVKPFVKLEQKKPKEHEKNASLEMMYNMWIGSSNGIPSQLSNFIGCPIEIRGDKIHVFLSFFAFPSSPDLDYKLSVDIGEIVTLVNNGKNRKLHLFVNNSDTVELPYWFERVSTMWTTQTFDKNGDFVTPPKVIHMGNWLSFEFPVFGVIEVSGSPLGEIGTVGIILDKPVEEVSIAPADWEENAWGHKVLTPPPVTSTDSLKITNLKCTVTATWLNDEGEEETNSLTLEAPDCIKSFLEMCPDMYTTILLICTKAYTAFQKWNVCTGDLIGNIYFDEPSTFCSKSVSKGPSQNLINFSSWLA